MVDIKFAELVQYVRCSSSGELDDYNPCPHHKDRPGRPGECCYWDSGDDSCHSSMVKALVGLKEEE